MNDKILNMLENSTSIVYEIIKNPNDRPIEEQKLIIASANTIANNIKTGIQYEILKYRMNTTNKRIEYTKDNINEN